MSSDRIITVSKMHARDITTLCGSMGLLPILEYKKDLIHGIVNGIDTNEWDPATDNHIPFKFIL